VVAHVHRFFLRRRAPTPSGNHARTPSKSAYVRRLRTVPGEYVLYTERLHRAGDSSRIVFSWLGPVGRIMYMHSRSPGEHTQAPNRTSLLDSGHHRRPKSQQPASVHRPPPQPLSPAVRNAIDGWSGAVGRGPWTPERTGFCFVGAGLHDVDD
jgi:hypothetical protein